MGVSSPFVSATFVPFSSTISNIPNFSVFPCESQKHKGKEERREIPSLDLRACSLIPFHTPSLAGPEQLPGLMIFMPTKSFIVEC